MTGGFSIRQQSCPRCAIRRTAHLADGSGFCFNCRLRWSGQHAASQSAVPPRNAAPPSPEPFSPAAWARLEMYRAAVRAGLYSDWPIGSAALEARR
ncbi:MAG: hypothetical protein JO057_29935 [Chloroflexi bacterium]|nr:hypothetical protein [Chloroflexota bacterium]